MEQPYSGGSEVDRSDHAVWMGKKTRR
uniref:Uncharacterized protein n=1 Tax=Arundo donax TaxID=35708 RepID=A0A0A9BV15_ARUDO